MNKDNFDEQLDVMLNAVLTSTNKKYIKELAEATNITDICRLIRDKHCILPRVAGMLLSGICILYKEKYINLYTGLMLLMKKLLPMQETVPMKRKSEKKSKNNSITRYEEVIDNIIDNCESWINQPFHELEEENIKVTDFIFRDQDSSSNEESNKSIDNMIEKPDNYNWYEECISRDRTLLRYEQSNLPSQEPHQEKVILKEKSKVIKKIRIDINSTLIQDTVEIYDINLDMVNNDINVLTANVIDIPFHLIHIIECEQIFYDNQGLLKFKELDETQHNTDEEEEEEEEEEKVVNISEEHLMEHLRGLTTENEAGHLDVLEHFNENLTRSSVFSQNSSNHLDDFLNEIHSNDEENLCDKKIPNYTIEAWKIRTLISNYFEKEKENKNTFLRFNQFLPRESVNRSTAAKLFSNLLIIASYGEFQFSQDKGDIIIKLHISSNYTPQRKKSFEQPYGKRQKIIY